MPSIIQASRIALTAVSTAVVLFAVVLFLSSCGSVTKQELKVMSEPADASVLTYKGQSIGRTPMTIDSSNRDQFDVGNGLAFIISKDGYRQREVHLTNYDIFEYKVSLAKLNDDDFAQVLGSDFGSQANDLSQRLLEAHGALIANDLTRAENLLNSLIEKYKKIGPLYTLKALVAIKKNDYASAEGLLRQALILNKSDQTANTVLAKIQGKAASGGAKAGLNASVSAEPSTGAKDPAAIESAPSGSAPASAPAADESALLSPGTAGSSPAEPAVAPADQLPKDLPKK